MQFVQEDGGIKLAVVPGPDSLYRLVDGFLVPVVKQVCDLSGPVHGLDFDLNGFRFIGRDYVIHGAHLTSGLDLDGVA